MKNPIVIFAELLKTESGEKSYKITDYVVSCTLVVYFIPIIAGLIFSLLNPIGLIFLGIVIFSAFPFTKYILIPKIDSKFHIYRYFKVHNKWM